MPIPAYHEQPNTRWALLELQRQGIDVEDELTELDARQLVDETQVEVIPPARGLPYFQGGVGWPQEGDSTEGRIAPFVGAHTFQHNSFGAGFGGWDSFILDIEGEALLGAILYISTSDFLFYTAGLFPRDPTTRVGSDIGTIVWQFRGEDGTEFGDIHSIQVGDYVNGVPVLRFSLNAVARHQWDESVPRLDAEFGYEWVSTTDTNAARHGTGYEANYSQWLYSKNVDPDTDVFIRFVATPDEANYDEPSLIALKGGVAPIIDANTWLGRRVQNAYTPEISRSPNLVVVHTTGYASSGKQDNLRYLYRSQVGISYHLITHWDDAQTNDNPRSRNTAWLDPNTDRAWAGLPRYNERAIYVAFDARPTEFGGFTDRDEALMFQAMGGQLEPYIAEHGIPRVRLNKAEVDAGASGFVAASDLDPDRFAGPGASFDWDAFLAAVSAFGITATITAVRGENTITIVFSSPVNAFLAQRPFNYTLDNIDITDADYLITTDGLTLVITLPNNLIGGETIVVVGGAIQARDDPAQLVERSTFVVEEEDTDPNYLRGGAGWPQEGDSTEGRIAPYVGSHFFNPVTPTDGVALGGYDYVEDTSAANSAELQVYCGDFFIRIRENTRRAISDFWGIKCRGQLDPSARGSARLTLSELADDGTESLTFTLENTGQWDNFLDLTGSVEWGFDWATDREADTNSVLVATNYPERSFVRSWINNRTAGSTLAVRFIADPGDTNFTPNLSDISLKPGFSVPDIDDSVYEGRQVQQAYTPHAGREPDIVVVHTTGFPSTEGKDSLAYLYRSFAGIGYHFITSWEDAFTQPVANERNTAWLDPTRDRAWGASRAYNNRAIHIAFNTTAAEMATLTNADTDLMFEGMASQLRPFLDQFGIPNERLTKDQVDDELSGFVAASDLDSNRFMGPGAAFRWDAFLREVGARLTAQVFGWQPSTGLIFVDISFSQPVDSSVARQASSYRYNGQPLPSSWGVQFFFGFVSISFNGTIAVGDTFEILGNTIPLASDPTRFVAGQVLTANLPQAIPLITEDANQPGTIIVDYTPLPDQTQAVAASSYTLDGVEVVVSGITFERRSSTAARVLVNLAALPREGQTFGVVEDAVSVALDPTRFFEPAEYVIPTIPLTAATGSVAGDTTLLITFSEPVEATSAVDPNNYTINGTAPMGATYELTLPDLVTITLMTPLAVGDQVGVMGVAAAANPNKFIETTILSITAPTTQAFIVGEAGSNLIFVVFTRAVNAADAANPDNYAFNDDEVPGSFSYDPIFFATTITLDFNAFSGDFLEVFAGSIRVPEFPGTFVDGTTETFRVPVTASARFETGEREIVITYGENVRNADQHSSYSYNGVALSVDAQISYVNPVATITLIAPIAVGDTFGIIGGQVIAANDRRRSVTGQLFTAALPTAPLTVSFFGSVGNPSFAVFFSENVVAAEAQNPANYTLNGAPLPDTFSLGYIGGTDNLLSVFFQPDIPASGDVFAIVADVISAADGSGRLVPATTHTF